MTQIQAGEGARFPHRRIPKGSLRERRSEGRAKFTKNSGNSTKRAGI
jgi:hypothetical protein